VHMGIEVAECLDFEVGEQLSHAFDAVEAASVR
jgi:hypothetical protein